MFKFDPERHKLPDVGKPYIYDPEPLDPAGWNDWLDGEYTTEDEPEVEEEEDE